MPTVLLAEADCGLRDTYFMIPVPSRLAGRYRRRRPGVPGQAAPVRAGFVDPRPGTAVGRRRRRSRFFARKPAPCFPTELYSPRRSLHPMFSTAWRRHRLSRWWRNLFRCLLCSRCDMRCVGCVKAPIQSAPADAAFSLSMTSLPFGICCKRICNRRAFTCGPQATARKLWIIAAITARRSRSSSLTFRCPASMDRKRSTAFENWTLISLFVS